MTSTNHLHKIERSLRGFLHRHEIPHRSHILVACSGGPDSVCLLRALKAACLQWSFLLTSVYLDHGIRPKEETGKEERFVRRICSGMDIAFQAEAIPRGDCLQEAKKKGRSLEEVAREKRYRLFYELLERRDADFLAVGHTLDDQMETLVMRFLQGSDICGLAGIPERRGHIIRPLLDCTREEVEDYLREMKMEYCTDRSNRDKQFLRNRIRHVLLPVIEQVFPGYRKSLAALSGKMGVLKRFLDEEIAGRSPWKPLSGPHLRGYKALGRSFLDLPAELRLQVLFRLADDIVSGERGGSLRIPYHFFAPVLDRDWFLPKRTLLRGYGLKLQWRGESLFLVRDVVGLYKKGYLIEVKDQDMVKIADTGLSVSVSAGRSETESGFNYSPQAVRGPLVVRSRRPGDTVAIDTGSKSVKKLLNEWQVPAEHRWMIPLVIDQRGVLAVMGGCLGFPDKFSADFPKKTSTHESSLTINYNRGISSSGDIPGE